MYVSTKLITNDKCDYAYRLSFNIITYGFIYINMTLVTSEGDIILLLSLYYITHIYNSILFYYIQYNLNTFLISKLHGLE